MKQFPVKVRALVIYGSTRGWVVEMNGREVASIWAATDVRGGVAVRISKPPATTRRCLLVKRG